MGLSQSTPSLLPLAPLIKIGPREPLVEKRFTNELIAYELLVKCDDGSSRRGLYFPEWKVSFYIYSNNLCVKYMVHNDITSKKIVIGALDANRFYEAYYVFRESETRLAETMPIFQQYVKEAAEKL
uniref:Uncharacterized protein n=1 Tax=viral metagenome TaxID=1070528 RepID=A0A6C0KY42_9ZZZZ